MALLWVGGFAPVWVEATGTWFGAIAPVLVLLWAVQTFRTDQAHREVERDDKELARRETLEAQAAADRDLLLQAEREALIVLDTTAAAKLGYRPVAPGRALLAAQASWVATRRGPFGKLRR